MIIRRILNNEAILDIEDSSFSTVAIAMPDGEIRDGWSYNRNGVQYIAETIQEIANGLNNEINTRMVSSWSDIIKEIEEEIIMMEAPDHEH